MMKAVFFLLAVGCLAGCSSIESNPSCEVLGESCTLRIQSCYANHSTGSEVCANTGMASEGHPCDTADGPDGSVVTLTNGCLDGLGCNLSAGEGDSTLTCAQYCDASTGIEGCSTGKRCCEIRSFYDCGGENTRAGLGFCVDPANFPAKFDGITGCPTPNPPPEGCR